MICGMNNKKSKIIAGVVFVFFLATFFPPWIYTHDRNGSSGGHAHKPAGFYCILWSPYPKSESVDDGVSIDMSRLMLEWLCILVTAGAAWFFMNADTRTASAAPPTVPLPRPVGNRKLFTMKIRGFLSDLPTLNLTRLGTYSKTQSRHKMITYFMRGVRI